MRTCIVSVDVEQDIGNQKTFRGVENLDKILEIFDKLQIRATLFTTGEILKNYPDLIERWSKKHEIACHGYFHVRLYELSMPEREKQLEDFCSLYERILGKKPKGFRAVEHTIDNAQLELLERFGFTYDSSVVPRYVPFRKYVGYKGKAPTEPYHPSYGNCREKGDMEILEIPDTPLVFGIPLCGTWLRAFGSRFYRVLLAPKKPRFISLAIHSWDCVKYRGRFPRHSGEKFLTILEELLTNLESHGYDFMSGQELHKLFKQARGI